MREASFPVGIDDTMFMAARWQAAGNTAEVDLYPEAHHGEDFLAVEDLE